MIAGRRLVHGVGLNDAGYRIADTAQINGRQVNLWVCPFYQIWHHMLMRCYSKTAQRADRNITYIKCSVDSEWHVFSNFRAWMIRQPWNGNEIDKDLLIPGNTIYGPDRCVFISSDLNKFATGRKSSSGKNPVGSSFNKRLGRFVGYCNNPFTRRFEHLGCFDSPESAHEAWRKRKHDHALRYADMQEDERVAAALRIRYLPENLHKIGI